MAVIVAVVVVAAVFGAMKMRVAVRRASRGERFEQQMRALRRAETHNRAR